MTHCKTRLESECSRLFHQEQDASLAYSRAGAGCALSPQDQALAHELLAASAGLRSAYHRAHSSIRKVLVLSFSQSTLVFDCLLFVEVTGPPYSQNG